MTDEGLAARSQHAAGVLLSCALSASMPSFGQERDASTVVLVDGVAVTRSQRANEPLHYLIDARRGQTLLIEVEQLGLDVVVSVESPVGEIRRFNSPLRRDESELVLIDDTYAGRYRLTVVSEEPTNAIGGHAVSFRSLNADAETRHLTALRHMSDGARANAESRGDDALRHFASASQLWEQLGETRRQAQARYSEAKVLSGTLYDWSDAASRAKEAAALYEQLDARRSIRQRDADGRLLAHGAGAEHGYRGAECLRRGSGLPPRKLRCPRSARQRLRSRVRRKRHRSHLLQPRSCGDARFPRSREALSPCRGAVRAPRRVARGPERQAQLGADQYRRRVRGECRANPRGSLGRNSAGERRGVARLRVGESRCGVSRCRQFRRCARCAVRSSGYSRVAEEPQFRSVRAACFGHDVPGARRARTRRGIPAAGTREGGGTRPRAVRGPIGSRDGGLSKGRIRCSARLASASRREHDLDGGPGVSAGLCRARSRGLTPVRGGDHGRQQRASRRRHACHYESRCGSRARPCVLGSRAGGQSRRELRDGARRLRYGANREQAGRSAERSCAGSARAGGAPRRHPVRRGVLTAHRGIARRCLRSRASGVLFGGPRRLLREPS